MKKASDLVKKFIESIENHPVGANTVIFRDWQSIAGIDLASHSEVVEVEDGVVLIKVDHPAWLQMFGMEKRKILRKLQHQYPELEIKAVRAF